MDNRWVCTCEMSKKITDLQAHSLDDVLEYFDFNSRIKGVKHDSVTDCHLTAKVYMKMTEKPDKKKEEVGFMDRYIKDK